MYVNLHCLIYSHSVYCHVACAVTGTRGHVHTLNDDDLVGQGDNELNIKIVRVTDSSVHLDWSHYVELEGMMYYRVVWSSVAQPAVCIVYIVNFVLFQ